MLQAFQQLRLVTVDTCQTDPGDIMGCNVRQQGIQCCSNLICGRLICCCTDTDDIERPDAVFKRCSCCDSHRSISTVIRQQSGQLGVLTRCVFSIRIRESDNCCNTILAAAGGKRDN